VNIKGIHKTSLIDFPGSISAIIFSGGCNLRCRYCHNPDLACNSCGLQGYSNDEALSFIMSRIHLIDAVVLSGGEPTLSPRIKDFTRTLKDLGLKVKLDTNGFNPDIVNDLVLEGLLDYIAMDVKTSFEKYYLFKVPENIEKVLAQSIQKIISSKIPYEFRTTCVPGVVTEEDICSIARVITGAKKYYLQQFRSHENVLDEEFLHIKPYSKQELYGFKSISEGFVEEVILRGI